MYSKVDMLARQTRTMLMDKLLDLEDTALPEGKQGMMMHMNLFFMLDSPITHRLDVALAVFNTLPWARSEVIEVPLDEGLPTMKQYSAFGRTGYAIGKWLSILISVAGELKRGSILQWRTCHHWVFVAITLPRKPNMSLSRSPLIATTTSSWKTSLFKRHLTSPVIWLGWLIRSSSRDI